MAQYTKDSLRMGWAYSALGGPYSHTEDYLTARDCYSRSMTIGRQINCLALEAVGYLNLGSVSVMPRNPDSIKTALSHYEKALELAETNNLTTVAEYARLNIAFTYTLSEDNEKVIAFLSDRVGAGPLRPSITNTALLLNLCDAYIGVGDYSQAERHLTLACEMAESAQYAHGKLYCLEFKTELREKQGRYKEALVALKEYQQTKSEQAGLEASQGVASLRTRLHFREKDLEIERLNEEKRNSEATYYQQRDFFLLSISLAILSLAIVIMISQYRLQSTAFEHEIEQSETKLQALQSQMYPRFIFNALGEIRNYIFKAEKIDAYNYLGKFATLLRIIAKYSTKVSIDLDQKVNFIEAYLDMEKIRLQNDFDYTIHVNEELALKNITVPSMVIQPVLEDILLNKLATHKGKGQIVIDFNPFQKGVQCAISFTWDEQPPGLKREVGENAKMSSELSIDINQRLRFLHKIGVEEVEMNIDDIYSNGEVVGAKVMLHLPIIDYK